MTTDEYTPHARRIYRNWLSKYERNKERMIARLEKCGLQSISHSRKNKGRNRRQATEEEILEGKLVKILKKLTKFLIQKHFLTKKKVSQNTLEKKCENSSRKTVSLPVFVLLVPKFEVEAGRSLASNQASGQLKTNSPTTPMTLSNGLITTFRSVDLTNRTFKCLDLLR